MPLVLELYITNAKDLSKFADAPWLPAKAILYNHDPSLFTCQE